ncbi:MAG TPA: hypothetical protein VNG51_09175 [Ktedonobacteraceae bacterium]|nr:hypothetical protein [Ktedonobacteraceae bacterium]
MDDTKQPTDKLDDIEEQIIPLDEASVPPEWAQVLLPFTKRLTFRQRKIAWRLSIALCFLLLTVLVVPGSLTSMGNVTTQLYNRFVPPPTPTLAPSLDSFYFDVNSPWTTVSIDGRDIQVPVIGSGSAIKLATGRHIVRWQAPPFQAQSCTITVPVQLRLSDTCVLTTGDLQQLPHPPHAQLLVLHESVNTLSINQQRMLLGAVQNALTQQKSSTTVQPGEMYKGTQGYTTANQPLQATLRFSLDPNAGSELSVGRIGTNILEAYTINAQDCEILCSLPWQIWLSRPPIPIAGGVSSAPTWFVLAFATQRWDFATMNGHTIASNLSAGNTFSHPVLLGIAWDGTNWHINVYFKQDIAPFYFLPQGPDTSYLPFYDNPACADAEDQLSNVVLLYAQIHYFPSANVADGCLAIAKWSGIYSPAPSSPYLWFLDRFGIFYPINAAALQESYPGAPQANVYEQRLAQQLAKLPGVVVNLS